MNLIDSLAAHPEVKSRDCGDGITSFNFTRKAFAKGLWDETNMRARGLFLDDSGAIVGRGYDKFFNVNQSPGFTRDEVIQDFVGPITVSEKKNGFLAIMFMHNGDTKIFTKGGPGDFADEARRVITASLGDNLDDFTQELLGRNASATFEIISDNDNHIIDEGAERAVLLDIIVNTDVYSPVGKSIVDKIGHDNGLEVAPYWVISEDDVAGELDRSAAMKTEGTVIMDSEGRMTKVKSDYYSRVKALRAGLTRIWLGRTPRRINDDLAFLIDNGMDQETISAYVVDSISGPEVNLPELVKDYFPEW